MDALVHLVLLCVCACARGEARGESGRDYEPYMYAAFPLHAPVPVLHVLSPFPLGPRARPPAPSALRPVYARAPYPDTEYASSAHSDYEAASYEPQRYASAQYASAPYTKQRQSSQLYASASSPPEEHTVLYARPNAHGGYSYHSSPNKPSARRAPYIMRVHKYRIVKER